MSNRDMLHCQCHFQTRFWNYFFFFFSVFFSAAASFSFFSVSFSMISFRMFSSTFRYLSVVDCRLCWYCCKSSALDKMDFFKKSLRYLFSFIAASSWLFWDRYWIKENSPKTSFLLQIIQKLYTLIRVQREKGGCDY